MKTQLTHNIRMQILNYVVYAYETEDTQCIRDLLNDAMTKFQLSENNIRRAVRDGRQYIEERVKKYNDDYSKERLEKLIQLKPNLPLKKIYSEPSTIQYQLYSEFNKHIPKKYNYINPKDLKLAAERFSKLKGYSVKEIINWYKLYRQKMTFNYDN